MIVVFVPFDHAQKFIKELLDIHLSKRFLQTTVYKTGQKVVDYFQKPVTGKEHVELLSAQAQPPDLVYVFTDGSFAPVLETDEKTGKKTMNYRENKLGLVVNAADIIKKETRQGKQITRITRKRFVTSLSEGTEPFKQALKKLLTITKAMQAKTIVLISDGAEWIGGLHRDIIPGAVKILDWYHAMEHLWNAARQHFGENAREEIERWVRPIEELLINGQINTALKVIWESTQTSKNQSELLKLYNYYYHNRAAMNYKEYRDKGFYIGSGAIESANKYIVTSRMKLTGCRWEQQTGNALIWLRCKYFEHDWDNFWENMTFRQYMSDGLTLKMAA